MTHQAKKFNTWALRGDTDADWYESYANRSIFELCDAAYILADVQPEYPGSLDTASNAAISEWVDTLKANIHELLAPSGYNEKEPLHHRLSHQKLRAWCGDTGTPWPIPESASDRIKALEHQLEDERKLRLKAQHLADPVMSFLVPADTIPSPTTLQLGEPEEVYRHLDYLTADQALDWMSRISGHQVEWDTLWGMIGFNMCRAFMDCRAVSGLTYAAEGEHEHRKVFGLGICQIMNAVRAEGAPLHLRGPAIHVDMFGLQEVVPKRSWWINNLESYDVLFRPSDIENMGQIVNERGGWSGTTPIMEIECDQFGEQAPEHSGSELAQRLGKLQITIDNLHDQIRYCVRFEDGQLLAELGSNLLPLAADAPANPIDWTDGASQADEAEIARLRELVATQSRLLDEASARVTEVSGSAGQVVFPYSTKTLLAMRDAALKHWKNLDPSKPAPYGIQRDVQNYISTITGNHSRKVFELASAIKPDNLPKN